MKNSLPLICIVALLAGCGEQPSQTNAMVAEIGFQKVVCGDHWFSATGLIEEEGAEIRLSGDSGPPTYPIPAHVKRVNQGSSRYSVFFYFNEGYLRVRPFRTSQAVGYWKSAPSRPELDLSCTIR